MANYPIDSVTRRHIQKSIDTARADIQARIQISATTRCLDHLTKMQAALDANNMDGVRYFWMAAQGASTVIPPVGHAGVVHP